VSCGVCVKVVGSANGSSSVISVSDVVDKLQLVSQSYNHATTRIIRSIELFKRHCTKYAVNMYASLYA